MNYDDFLARVIDSGIAACSEDYASSPAKLRGAVAGFEACRGVPAESLIALLQAAGQRVTEAFGGSDDDYWEAVCYRAEIEWVCNVVSAALVNEGQPPIIAPTARGMMQAARILGVSA